MHDLIQMEGCISIKSQKVLHGDGNTIRSPRKLFEMINAVIAYL